MRERSADLTAQTAVPVSERHASLGFFCGKVELDDFFARHAVDNDRRGIGKTFVLCRGTDDPALPEVLGYYTLSMASVETGGLPKKIRRGLPSYPMPVALIGRLAVDRRAQGQHVGEALLADALRRVLSAAGVIGCFGVIVDAKDASAEGFYAKYGFAPIGDGYPKRLFLGMKTIRAGAAP